MSKKVRNLGLTLRNKSDQFFNLFCIWSLTDHSSEIGSLCLMKCSSETIQNFLFFGNIISAKWKAKKNQWVFVFQKYGKFCSVSLELFHQARTLKLWWVTYNVSSSFFLWKKSKLPTPSRSIEVTLFGLLVNPENFSSRGFVMVCDQQRCTVGKWDSKKWLIFSIQCWTTF